MSVGLLPLATFLIFLLLLHWMDWRRAFIAALIAIAVLIVLITEPLSVVRKLSPLSVKLVWAGISLTSLWLNARYRSFRFLSLSRVRSFWHQSDNITKLCVVGTACILLPLAVIARLGAPTIPDAMGYHLPRIVFWAQAQSVSFFPTDFPQQIFMQPFLEYTLLQTFLLSGTDRWVNVVQWVTFAGCIVAVSLVAQRLRANRRGQAMAALFCATLPIGVLQATGTKNDLLLAFFMTSMAVFGLCFLRDGRTVNLMFASAALSLALLTKGTAYIFVPPLLVGLAFCRPDPQERRSIASMVKGLAVISGFIVVLNGAHYYRCYRYSGSPLGPSSAYSDGAYRFRNDKFGATVTASNLLRNVGVHFNQFPFVVRLVERAHTFMNVPVDDPATTWPGTKFKKLDYWCPAYEICAPSTLHMFGLLFIVPAFLLLCIRDRLLIVYYATLAAMFLLFCALLRWQPWHARMHSPMIVLGCALLGTLAGLVRRQEVSALICSVALVLAQSAVYRNFSRPLAGWETFWGYDNIMTTAWRQLYFFEFKPSEQGYNQAAALIRDTGCRQVGIDNSYDRTTEPLRTQPLEYPMLALIREELPGAKFIHVGVHDRSRRYAANTAFKQPCAVVCLYCGNDPQKGSQYEFGTRAVKFENVVVFVPDGSAK